MAAIAAPAYIWILPRCPAQETSRGYDSFRKLDLAGSLLFLAMASTIIMAIAFGGSIYSWNSGQIITLFVCFGILWIFFAIQQTLCVFTTESTRVFPVSFFRSGQLAILFIETAAAISGIVIPIYLIPLFFQFVRSETALQAAVHTLPFIGATVVGAY